MPEGKRLMLTELSPMSIRSMRAGILVRRWKVLARMRSAVRWQRESAIESFSASPDPIMRRMDARSSRKAASRSMTAFSMSWAGNRHAGASLAASDEWVM